MKLTHRHDAIVRLMRRRGTTTVQALADEFHVSRRTILRDVVQLRDRGFLIYSEPGPGGGLQLDHASYQTTAPLRAVEVFALIICVGTMRQSGYLPFSDIADAGLVKIEKSLSTDTVRDLRRLLARTYIGKIAPQQDLSDLGAIDPDLLDVTEQAFLGQYIMTFQYCDAAARNSFRQVEPQAILILAPVWYLVAWDLEKEAFRHFRMDRISGAEYLSDHKFRQRHVPFEDDICPFSAVS